MIDLTKEAKRPYHRIRLSREAKSDLATWLTFLDRVNGKTFSWKINGKHRLSSSCLLMQPVLRAMVLSLVSIGFAARGLLCGPP